MQLLEVINPSTGELLQRYQTESSAQLLSKIEISAGAFQGWRRVGIPQRAAAVLRLGQVLERDLSKFATRISLEMGKPILQAEAEVAKCAACCRYFAEHSAEILAAESIVTEARYSAVWFEPLGVILAVMPWNFPFWQVLRCAVPAIMAGNTVLLKHASNVAGCALAIEEAFNAAEFPEGVFTNLVISAEQVPEVIAHPAVKALSLTGSEKAGRIVATQCGRELKKIVLELGGSDPFIVLEDANLNLVVEQAMTARLQACGQSCIAAKRFLISGKLIDAFQDSLLARLKELKIGDPFDRTNQLGPLARADIRVENENLIQSSVAAGAKLVWGGDRPLEGVNAAGFFLRPALLRDVPPSAPAFVEESFGPIFSLTSFRLPEEALALANQSRFGLGASIWTEDPEAAKKLAAGLDSGMVFINAIVKSDSRLPFGGVKASGYGRELGIAGAREFVNIKTVLIN